MLGQVVKNEALSSIELPDDPRMKSGEYTMKIIDGKIEFELAWWKKSEIEAGQKKIDFDKNIEDINNAKSVEELKPLLIKLINK